MWVGSGLLFKVELRVCAAGLGVGVRKNGPSGYSTSGLAGAPGGLWPPLKHGRGGDGDSRVWARGELSSHGREMDEASRELLGAVEFGFLGIRVVLGRTGSPGSEGPQRPIERCSGEREETWAEGMKAPGRAGGLHSGTWHMGSVW